MATYDGGCLSGKVRFRLAAEAIETGYCHCRMCQRNTGAPVVAWTTFPAASFSWTAAGIENFRLHDLRHSCPSYLAAGGVSLLEIADTLGHRTLAMVKRYSHLTQAHKVAAIETMAKERGL